MRGLLCFALLWGRGAVWFVASLRLGDSTEDEMKHVTTDRVSKCQKKRLSITIEKPSAAAQSLIKLVS
jgi:hypothetical protein